MPEIEHFHHRGNNKHNHYSSLLAIKKIIDKDTIGMSLLVVKKVKIDGGLLKGVNSSQFDNGDL